MQKIQLLDNQTINKIAAGEVVESPKSVVKELVENAIDANASAITIEIKEGGISFIRITPFDFGGSLCLCHTHVEVRGQLFRNQFFLSSM